MSKKVAVKNKESALNKYIERQISWCKRNFPAGTLVRFTIPWRNGSPYGQDAFGIVVGYKTKSLSNTVYLNILSQYGTSLIAPNAAQSTQRLFCKPLLG